MRTLVVVIIMFICIVGVSVEILRANTYKEELVEAKKQIAVLTHLLKDAEKKLYK